MIDADRANKGFERWLQASGPVMLLPAAIFTGRIVWEETFLTLRDGPQMVGFSLLHGPFAFLVLAPLLLCFWLTIALFTLLIVLIRRRVLLRALSVLAAVAVVILTVVSLPPTFWQWAFIGTFARSPKAAELMTGAAAEGYAKTVLGYLDHGVSLEARNYEGSTAAYTAAVGNKVSVLRLLARRGADLNAVNTYGDSPLEAAVEDHHTEAAYFLRQHGAKQVRGSEEQHRAASQAIVERQIRSLRQ